MDLYIILEVSKNDSCEDIKLKCKNRFKTLHPDQGGDREAFDLFLNAYNILIDPQKRKEYDETGKTTFDIIKTPEEKAFEIIMQFYVSSLDSIVSSPNFNPESTCIFTLIRTSVEKHKINLEQNIINITNQINKLSILQKNIVSDNLYFVKIINDKITILNNALKDLKESLKLHPFMLDILKNSKTNLTQIFSIPMYSINTSTTSTFTSF